MKHVRKLVRWGLHRVGIDIRRLSSASNPTYQIVQGLQKFDVDLVLDVGANIGQFASELRSVGYAGDILSFEPLSEAHRLLQVASARDRKWTVYKRSAIGDVDGEIEINISGNSVSSSVLPMTSTHSSAAPESSYVGCETVPILRLDSIGSDILSSSSRPFLKVDTQGFEWQVLDGSKELLSRFEGILCELSIVPLYIGQKTWVDVIDRLKNEGFTLWSIQQGFTDPRDGRSLQVDVTFFRL